MTSISMLYPIDWGLFQRNNDRHAVFEFNRESHAVLNTADQPNSSLDM